MTTTYKCAACGDVFETERDQDEAYAEARANFGTDPSTDPTMEVVCDECYRAMEVDMPCDEFNALAADPKTQG